MAVARGASMHAIHLVNRAVCPPVTNAVVTTRVDPFATGCLQRLQRAREVGAMLMWYTLGRVFIRSSYITLKVEGTNEEGLQFASACYHS